MPTGHRPAPPVDTIRVSISGTQQTQPWTNVIYLNVTTDGTKTAADLKSITDAVVAAYFLRFKAQLPPVVTLTSVRAVWITSVGNELEYQASYTDVMTGGNGVDNTSTCVVLNWSIPAYYRGGHPRSYLPGAIQANVTNGSTITAAYATAIAAAGVLFISDVNALTATHILTTQLGTVSFANGNAWRSPPIFRAYSSASVRSTLGTQRRRLGGR